MAMTLAELCTAWVDVEIMGDGAAPVAAVVEDSRQVVPGAVFVAVAGTGADGHAYLAQAITAGAVAVVVERARLASLRAALPSIRPVAWVTASSTRGLSARLAREFEGRPDESLQVVGITGTNGKTTTAFLLHDLLAKLRGRCGLLGTIRYDDGSTQIAAPLTTPGGPLLYRWLRRMIGAGCAAAALEVSSHALAQDRCGDLALDAAVMTNLGRDHLDYHGDVHAYLAAKSRILELVAAGPRRRKPAGVAVINANDPALAPLAAGAVNPVLFAAAPDDTGRAVDLAVRQADLGLDGTRLRIDWRGQTLHVRSPLVGRFNVENLAAALATAAALGYDPGDCAAALSASSQVPGRLERIALPQGALAVVDYAHTHDALAAILRACRQLGGRRLAVVFGCGGDRDRGKRPLMGQVAAELADRVWITTDNPRSEEPAAIAAAIAAGFDTVKPPRAAAREIVLDRRAAIEAALAAAGEGDVVVVAGKGHEDYQLVQGRVLQLDDRQIIRDWIARKDRHG
jgi:UDP-N-acetylmuramoyl-L-alanyl-D-glutamate--2,6-diaminopimelate ligase